MGMRRSVVVLTVAVVALALAACGERADVIDVGAAPSRDVRDATTPRAAAASDDIGSTSPTGSDTTTRGDPGPASGEAPRPADRAPPGDPGQPGPEPATPASTTVVVYLTQGEQVAAVPRSVARVARIGTVTLEALLAGPTAQERSAGYGSEIPATTRLRGLSISGGVAIVDLSGDFESGGGTLGLTLRLAQVVCTLDQFPTVDGVRFALDGTVVDVFSGDGIIIDEPVACGDYADLVAG
jgi:hypothetical protein